MKTSRPLLALLLAATMLSLSGCFGIPEGTARPGDFVQATVSVLDAETGQLLLDSQVVGFAIGRGESGLGFAFERAVIGKAPQERFTLEMGDRAIAFRGVEERPSLLASLPLENRVSRGEYDARFGVHEVGDEFTAPGDLWMQRVIAVTDTEVTFRYVPQDGQRDVFPAVAATLVTTLDEAADQMVLHLDPEVGALFVVARSPLGETFLGLDVGTYRHLESHDPGLLRFESAPTQYPFMVERAVRIEAIVHTVQGLPPQEDGGNIGVRTSPYINGAPSAEPFYGAHLPAADQGEDHDH